MNEKKLTPVQRRQWNRHHAAIIEAGRGIREVIKNELWRVDHDNEADFMLWLSLQGLTPVEVTQRLQQEADAISERHRKHPEATRWA